MPLKQGSSKATISKNIATEKKAHPSMPIKQAVAISYNVARENVQKRKGKEK